MLPPPLSLRLREDDALPPVTEWLGDTEGGGGFGFGFSMECASKLPPKSKFTSPVEVVRPGGISVIPSGSEEGCGCPPLPSP